MLTAAASVSGDGEGGSASRSTAAELAALPHDALVDRVLAAEADREAADGIAMGKLRALAAEVRRLRSEREEPGGRGAPVASAHHPAAGIPPARHPPVTATLAPHAGASVGSRHSSHNS